MAVGKVGDGGTGAETPGGHGGYGSMWQQVLAGVIAGLLLFAITVVFAGPLALLGPLVRHGATDGRSQFNLMLFGSSVPLLLGALVLAVPWPRGRCARRAFVWAAWALIAMGAVGLAIVSLLRYQFVGSEAALRAKLPGLRWVAYESPGLDRAKGSVPPQGQVEEELQRLRRHGFNGLITFSGEGGQAEVARIAKQLGFRAVIRGIYPPEPFLSSPRYRTGDPEADRRAALEEQRWVDGYCVGHNASPAVDMGWLRDQMNGVRLRTRKPVATTFQTSSYTGSLGDRVARLGDWLFPDIHADWCARDITPQQALQQTRDAYDQIEQVSRSLGGKPVLLKMISYPSGGSNEGRATYTEQSQAAFLRAFLRWRRSALFDPFVGVSVFSAYDLPWKRPADGWSSAEQHAGIFHVDGSPKPAAQVLGSSD